MKCALNDGDLYIHPARYICTDCVFEDFPDSKMCVNIGLCRTGSIIKRSDNQSNIFKI